jgi:phosphoserine aminotransferase
MVLNFPTFNRKYNFNNLFDYFFSSPVEKKSRSRVTIPFRITENGQPSEKLEKQFLEEAEKVYLFKELKGHRSVGGLRAAIFNALSLEEIESFVAYMKIFQSKHQ